MTDLAFPQSMFLFAAATALLFAAAHDVAVRTVPNSVSLSVALLGLALNAVEGRFVFAVTGGGLVFAASWYCWRRGLIGGGDVKLVTACALLVPPTSVPEFIFGTAIAGGLLALVYLTLGRLLTDAVAPRPRGFLRRVWRAERRRISRGMALPYCCAIVASALLTLCSPYRFI
jgi:prepilin peptidase CpaA